MNILGFWNPHKESYQSVRWAGWVRGLGEGHQEPPPALVGRQGQKTKGESFPCYQGMMISILVGGWSDCFFWLSQKSLPGSQGLLDTHPLPASTVPNHIAGRILRLAPAFALQLHFFKFCVQRIMLFASPSGLDGMGVWVDPIRISNQIPPGCNTTVLHPFFKCFYSIKNLVENWKRPPFPV